MPLSLSRQGRLVIWWSCFCVMFHQPRLVKKPSKHEKCCIIPALFLTDAVVTLWYDTLWSLLPYSALPSLSSPALPPCLFPSLGPGQILQPSSSNAEEKRLPCAPGCPCHAPSSPFCLSALRGGWVHGKHWGESQGEVKSLGTLSSAFNTVPTA